MNPNQNFHILILFCIGIIDYNVAFATRIFPNKMLFYLNSPFQKERRKRKKKLQKTRTSGSSLSNSLPVTFSNNDNPES